jgi:hypothetical protein
MLSLYPRAYREQFGDEMRQVFGDVCAAMAQENPGARLAFYLSEFRGLLWGAASEHIRALGAPHGFEFFGKRSLYMQPERRFSKAAIVFMTLVLGVIVLTIVKAQGVAYYMEEMRFGGKVAPFGNSLADWPSHWGLLASIALFFVLTWLAAIVAWTIAHSMRRSGVHRLDDAQTWPQTR